MASFEKRGDRWRVRVCVGKLKSSKTFKTKEKADKWANDMEESLMESVHVRASNNYDLTNRQLKRLYSRTKSNSKLNDIGHFITFEYFADLWEKSEKRCAISGLMFSDYQPASTRRRPFSPSVDRIDCTQGYNEGNIRFVCVAANIARSDFPDDILFALAKGICSHAPYAKLLGQWAV